MRNLLATTAIAAMMSLPAAAQQSSDSTETDQTTGNTEAAQQEGSGNDPQLQNRGMTISASDLMNHSVHIMGEDSESAEELPTELSEAPDDWEDAGEIEDIILTADGEPKSVVLNVGELLDSDKKVEASFDDLRLISDSDNEGEFFVVYTGDRSQLEEAEEFDTAAVEERGDQSFNEQGGSMDTAQTDQSGSAETGDDATQQAQSDSAEDSADMETDSAQTEEGGTALSEGDSTEQAESDTEMGDEQSETAQTEEGGTLTTEGEGTDQAESGMTDEQTESESEMAATEEPDAAETGDGPTYLADNERGALTADDIEGLSVYGTNGEDIGEISELVLAEDGKIENVVIDVGGFLGIGEKHVAVPFDELKLSRAEGGLMNDLRVDVNYTEEELESMQSWEE